MEKKTKFTMCWKHQKKKKLLVSSNYFFKMFFYISKYAFHFEMCLYFVFAPFFFFLQINWKNKNQ